MRIKLRTARRPRVGDKVECSGQLGQITAIRRFGDAVNYYTISAADGTFNWLRRGEFTLHPSTLNPHPPAVALAKAGHSAK